MSDAVQGSFSVLLAGKEDLRSDIVAAALADFSGITTVDAAMAVRRGRGIVAEGLGQGEAEGLARRLIDAGVAAVAVEAAALPVLPAAEILSRAAPGPEGLRVSSRAAGERLLPWPRVRIVAVAPVNESIESLLKTEEGPSGGEMAMRAGIMAVTGIPIGLGEKKKVEKKVVKIEFRLFLDLLLRGPSERLRAEATRFDFSGLGARKAYSSHLNMKALVEEILRGAPRAASSPGADLLLTGGRLSSLGYQSLADFEREERWLAAVAPA